MMPLDTGFIRGPSVFNLNELVLDLLLKHVEIVAENKGCS